MLPKINQMLVMQVASFDEEEADQKYKSRIADIDDQCFLIEIPIHVGTGKLKKLQPGDHLSVSFVTEGGVDNFFDSQVVGFKEDIFRLVMIRKPDPGTITRSQRRGFLRVPADLEMAVNLSDEFKFLVITDDVGGGGVSFVCEGFIPLKEKDHLSCWLLIHFKNGVIEHAFFKGEIVRIKLLENGKQLVMMKYADIADMERQKIMRFCFERQLDFRKR